MPFATAGAQMPLLPAPELMTAAAEPQPPQPSLEQPAAAQARLPPLLSDLGAHQRNSLPPRPAAPALGADSLKRGVSSRHETGAPEFARCCLFAGEASHIVAIAAVESWLTFMSQSLSDCPAAARTGGVRLTQAAPRCGSHLGRTT